MWNSCSTCGTIGGKNCSSGAAPSRAPDLRCSGDGKTWERTLGRRGGADGHGCDGLEDAWVSSSPVGTIARTDGACASNEPMKVWCACEFHGDGEDEHFDIAASRAALDEAAFTKLGAVSGEADRRA